MSKAGGELRRATLTLVAGGALAQVIPLLLGPWLTRLYEPAQFGVYHLFAAAAANVAVAGCARYEFALPLARDDAEAAALRVLCLRLLAAAVMLSACAAAGWAWRANAVWPLWLPLAVAALGLLSLFSLQATAARRFRALAAARVVQYGGGALGQAGAALAGAGTWGLIAAPIVAAGGAALLLAAQGGRRPAEGSVPRGAVGAAARAHRAFPLLNTPHAFLGALQDTLSLALVAAAAGPAAAGFWGLALRYLKAPATLVGGAVSQALYPHLGAIGIGATAPSRSAVVRVMKTLALLAAPLVVALWIGAPWAFEKLFGSEWRAAGELARALALYIGLHFVAAPLAVVTMAWDAQGWALRFSIVGQAIFVAALALGLRAGGLTGAGWTVSAAMLVYFGVYFLRLAHWPLPPVPAAAKA